MPCLSHPFLISLKCAPSQHGANSQQIIYQAALFAWQSPWHFSIIVFCACSAGWSPLLFLIFSHHPFYLQKGTISPNKQWGFALAIPSPSIPSSPPGSFPRDILKPSGGSLSWFHGSVKVFPTAEEAAELPFGLWTQERSHCQRICQRDWFALLGSWK